MEFIFHNYLEWKLYGHTLMDSGHLKCSIKKIAFEQRQFLSSKFSAFSQELLLSSTSVLLNGVRENFPLPLQRKRGDIILLLLSISLPGIDIQKLMLVVSIVGLCMSKQNQWENVCNEETRKETDKKKERRSNGIK